MKTFTKFVLATALLVGVYACSTPEAAPLDATGGKTVNKPTVVRHVIPAGTQLRVALIDSVDSDTSSAGDHFMASLAEGLVIDGKTFIAQGTLIRGLVVNAQGSARVKGLASIKLELIEIQRAGGKIAITTEPFVATAESTKGRDAGIIAGGAGVGAAIGAIAGGKKGAGIGAIVGGGAGTGAVLATTGKNIHYGPESRFNFTLANSIQL